MSAAIGFTLLWSLGVVAVAVWAMRRVGYLPLPAVATPFWYLLLATPLWFLAPMAWALVWLAWVRRITLGEDDG